MLKTTYREKLWEAAADHFGYVTTHRVSFLILPIYPEVEGSTNDDAS